MKNIWGVVDSDDSLRVLIELEETFNSVVLDGSHFLVNDVFFQQLHIVSASVKGHPPHGLVVLGFDTTTIQKSRLLQDKILALLFHVNNRKPNLINPGLHHLSNRMSRSLRKALPKGQRSGISIFVCIQVVCNTFQEDAGAQVCRKHKNGRGTLQIGNLVK